MRDGDRQHRASGLLRPDCRADQSRRSRAATAGRTARADGRDRSACHQRERRILVRHCQLVRRRQGQPGRANHAAAIRQREHSAAAVTDFAYNPYGRFIVFLDNGQIWQQLEGDTDRARFSKSKKDMVTISRGFLGSYNLVIGDHSGMFKVKRIK